MLTKRIIPCLDVKDGRVVKGIRFKTLRDAGDPVALAQRYNDEGADEIVFLDITASAEKRRFMVDLAERVARRVFIPFTIGGGITTVEDMRVILSRGADKVTVNTAAVKAPELIEAGAKLYGSQCIVLAMDVKREPDGCYYVYIYGGRQKTQWEAVSWARRAVTLGAGEILLTSMDSDGMQCGFDLDITRRIGEAVSVPVIASGGGGRVSDFYDVLIQGKADAVLAASVFHYETMKIGALKAYLKKNGIPVRSVYD